MSAAAAIPAAVPGAGAGDRVELDNHDDAECEPPLKRDEPICIIITAAVAPV
jgi:hypothetical protein